MCLTPRWASASTTALTKAAGEPTLGDSPTPLAPKGWCGRGRAGFCRLPVGSFDRGRYQVVHETSALHVAVVVVADLLHEGDRQALGESTVDLTFDDHGIDDVAAIVHSDKTADLDLAGTLVDVYDADVGTEGEGEVGRVVVVDGFECRLPCPAACWCTRRRRCPGWSWTCWAHL